MGFWKAAQQGFGLTFRLWYGILMTLFVSATLGAIATVVLPYEVSTPMYRVPVTVHGQRQEVVVKSGQESVSVPPVKTPQEAASRMGPVGSLYTVSLIFFLFLLGAVLGSVKKLLGAEGVTPARFLADGFHWVFPMMGWALGLGVLALLFSLMVGWIPVSLYTKTAADAGLLGIIVLYLTVFLTAYFLMVLLFLFSPVVLVERGLGLWKSFGEAFRFLVRHFLGVVGLLFCVTVVGVIARVAAQVIGGVVDPLYSALHIPTNARGWPVFFSTFLVGLPNAFLTVYFPAVLYTYYHSNQQKSS